MTIKERIVVLNVQSNRKNVSHGFLAGIFGTLDRFGVVVDLISTSEVFVSMAIEDILDRKLQARLVRDLEKIGIVRLCIPSFFFLPFATPRFSLPILTGVRIFPSLHPLGGRRAYVLARSLPFLGIRASRHGDIVHGGKADAKYGRSRRAHVHDARAGQR